MDQAYIQDLVSVYSDFHIYMFISKTKIVVLRMKEVIYTAIFVGLAILLLILCFIMFRPEKQGIFTKR